MVRAVLVASLLGLLGAVPLSAQDTAPSGVQNAGSPDCQVGPVADIATPPARAAAAEEVFLGEAPAWQTAWGLVGLRGIPAGPKTAPNGLEYHPNFSLDLDLNFWV